MNDQWATITKTCSLCQGDLKEVISFGETPLANEFLKQEDLNQDTFPLNLMECQSCNNVQLDCSVDPERLYRNYVYVTGTSKVNQEHYKSYANDVESRYLEEGDFILDIGSNDGSFLSYFSDNIFRLGVDPASSIASDASNNGIRTIPTFFNEDTAEHEILYELQKFGFSKAKVITCNHCFAHTKDIETILNGVVSLLDKDGVFVFENSYLLDVVNKGLFDLVYSEHYYHHHLIPLVKLLDRFNLRIFDLKRLPEQHGGSIRVFVCHKSAKYPMEDIVEETLKEEMDLSFKLHNTFKDNISKLKYNLNKTVFEIKNEHKTIGIYGFPAKATTILYGLGLSKSLNLFDFVVDSNPIKQGLFIPGGGHQVKHPDEVVKRQPDYLLILAWNFSESIVKNCQKAGFKGKFIIPLPEFKII
jgi:hypothetical protein